MGNIPNPGRRVGFPYNHGLVIRTGREHASKLGMCPRDPPDGSSVSGEVGYVGLRVGGGHVKEFDHAVGGRSGEDAPIVV